MFPDARRGFPSGPEKIGAVRRWAAEAGAKQFAQRLSRRQECGALRQRWDICRPLPFSIGQRDIVVPVIDGAVESRTCAATLIGACELMILRRLIRSV